jgi:hypothetical protein
VPSALIVALNGLIVVLVVSSERFRRRLRRRVEATEVAEISPDSSAEAGPAIGQEPPAAPAASSKLGSSSE